MYTCCARVHAIAIQKNESIYKYVYTTHSKEYTVHYGTTSIPGIYLYCVRLVLPGRTMCDRYVHNPMNITEVHAAVYLLTAYAAYRVDFYVIQFFIKLQYNRHVGTPTLQKMFVTRFAEGNTTHFYMEVLFIRFVLTIPA